MIVFFQFESRSINAIKTENDEDAFYFMLSHIPSMSELRCSERGHDDECIDLAKVKSFGFINDEHYRGVFGTKKIVLTNVGEDVEIYDWNPYNYVGERKITSPISVYDPMNKKYYVGVLEVYMYEE
jgi:hypothetical protein